ncbi:MAG: polyphenol oxidase family protein [Gemmatimonadetes bacterium]|nr:polyphenol oxidase family protein [Gemmatimonadota bacterium]
MPADARPARDGLEQAAWVDGMPAGVLALTTTRDMGSFGLGDAEPVGAVMDRWRALQRALAAEGITRMASAHQVHGAAVVEHGGGWDGWVRLEGVDGHVTARRGTALVVTVADCTPVLVAHPRGAVAALHAGWRGTASGILERGLRALARRGYPAAECEVHLGPAICGACYEVGPEVLSAVYGRTVAGKGCLDVRAVLAEQARAAGVANVTVSGWCTRCHGDRFFSHRGGDTGRQLGVIALPEA